MRSLRIAAGSLLVATLACASGLGQEPAPLELTAPFAPAPQPAAPEPVKAAKAPPERWPLMREAQGTWPGWLLEDNRMLVWGWTNASFTASSAAHDQSPMGFNYRANEFLLQQNWLRVERTVDTAATTPTWGFRWDTILPGSDYRYTVARGLFSGQLTANDGEPNTYGIDPVQFYLEAYFPQIGRGLDVKVGRFFCQYGAESIAAADNALGSRSYAFIYDPFTHTGAMGTLKLTDAWSAQSGIVLGSDVFIDPAANPTYMGSVKWAPPNGPTSVLFSVILGKGNFDTRRQFNNPEVFDLVVIHKVNGVLTWTLEALWAFQTGVPDIGFANNAALVNYLTYQLSPRLSATARYELFDDFQGQRTGFEGLYQALTLGLTFKVTREIWLRPEVRYDYNAESRPFEGQHGVFTAAADVVVRW